MRRILLGIFAAGSTLALAGCGGSSTDTTETSNTHIEAMGPEGGSNVTTTAHPGADTAPVGATDAGNVAPGDANPDNPRPGATAGDNSQAPGNAQ